MKERLLGGTGLRVSAVGLGCGGLSALSQADAEILVHTALDLGVSVFDCAASYGDAEQKLGAALEGHRRSSLIVAKGGYGIDGVPDWTGRAVARGVDRALERLRTDYVDVFLLHSCTLDALSHGDLIEPLLQAKQAGKVRAVGYAGDGDALEWAVRCGAFDVIECSVNLFDQRALATAVPRAVMSGIGVIGKRALGNAPWRDNVRPQRFDAGLYWDRMHAMFEPGGQAWTELAVRFAAYAQGVDCALVGTKNPVHLGAAIEAAERGPLEDAQVGDVRERFTQQDLGWEGVV